MAGGAIVKALKSRRKPEQELGFDLANVAPESTGLPFVVWVAERMGARHDVRVYVSPGFRVRSRAEFVAVAIRPAVRVVKRKLGVNELALLTRWIELNRDALVKYWDGDISTSDVLRALKPLGANGNQSDQRS